MSLAEALASARSVALGSLYYVGPRDRAERESAANLAAFQAWRQAPGDPGALARTMCRRRLVDAVRDETGRTGRKVTTTELVFDPPAAPESDPVVVDDLIRFLADGDERTATILRMVAHGHERQAAGARVGVTKGRVTQILRAVGRSDRARQVASIN